MLDEKLESRIFLNNFKQRIFSYMRRKKEKEKQKEKKKQKQTKNIQEWMKCVKLKSLWYKCYTMWLLESNHVNINLGRSIG